MPPLVEALEAYLAKDWEVRLEEALGVLQFKDLVNRTRVNPEAFLDAEVVMARRVHLVEDMEDPDAEVTDPVTREVAVAVRDIF